MHSSEPKKILDDAIMYGISACLPRKPGAVIERLSKEKREILSKLKSDDIKNQRWPL